MGFFEDFFLVLKGDYFDDSLEVFFVFYAKSSDYTDSLSLDRESM